ncbi:MAG: PKD domain-containing protein, partial [Nocardioidaceae bacterium]
MKVIQRPVVAVAAMATILGTATATAAMVDVASGSTPAVVQQADALDLVRSFPTVEHGVSRPTGLAWSPQLGALLVAGDAGRGSTVTPVTPAEQRLGRVGLPGVADADAVAVEPLTGRLTAASGGALLSYSASGLRTSAPHAVRKSSGAMRLRSPRAMSYDRSGGLVVLDGGSLVRRSTTGKVTRVPISGVDAADLRGLTVRPDADLVYSYDTTGRDVVGIDRRGRVVESRDAGALDLADVQGIAFAPSADATDDPSIQNLFVADAGAPGSTGEIVEASLQAASVALTSAVSGTLVRTTDTSQFNPPSPDPSGLAYLPGADRLFIADGEVDEMPIFEGANFFRTTRSGTVDQTGVSQPWSNEPVGVGYNPGNNHLFVTDDDQKEVYEILAGGDGRFGTPDDTRTHSDTAKYGNTDPEGVDYDSATNSLWFADGVNAEVYRLRPGGDGQFGTSDDISSHFDVGVFGARDPEGLGYDSVRNTVVMVDDGSDTIYEFDQTGALLNTISTAAGSMQAAAGLAVAPGSSNPTQRNYYVVARGLDNDSHPTENDGKMYEFSAVLPPVGDNNAPPTVSAGADDSVELPLSAMLNGTVTDDGRPNPPGAVTTGWAEVSGPGVVTFGNAGAVDTTASFSSPGTYVLRLSADDGEALMADDVTILVLPEGSPDALQVPMAAGTDDVEQAVTGSVALTSSDLELGADGNTAQIVGTRFAGVQIPDGSQIIDAYVQFRVDEVSTGATSLTIRAENADNTPTYQAVSGSVAARPTTTASVAWTPPVWSTIGERGPAQRTPNIAALVQEIVDRPGWNQGNALAFQFRGTGRRTAEAYESGAAFAPTLHLQYGPGGPAVNQPPTVSAGIDQTIQLPASAALDGTVTDDGLPNPPGAVTTAWSEVSGPGDVTFGNAAAVDTSASFSAAGTYVLRLTANDGALIRTDDVTVVVQPVGTPVNQPPTVGAGADQTVQLPASAALDGTVTDDGLPNPPGAVTTAWSEVSGPGDVTFGNAAAVDTSASFSAAGTYVLRLTANDGALIRTDDVTVVVQPAGGGGNSVDIPVRAGSDDAEER